MHEGDTAPEFCPICKAPASKFVEQKEDFAWADEHRVGVAKDVDADIVAGLRMNFEGECTEVGMYLAMARVAHREGYPEIGLYWEKAAYEEAEHAAKFAELLGEVVTDSTKKNLELRVAAENGACAGKKILPQKRKNLVWMQFMTLYMRWQKTRLGMAERLKACLRDISAKLISVVSSKREQRNLLSFVSSQN